MARPTGPWGLLILYFSQLFGSRWQNGIWYKPDGALPGGFDVQAAANDIYVAAKTALQPALNEQTTFNGARFFVNNGVYTTSADSITTYGGTGTSGPIPPDDFVIVRSQTNAAGKNSKGRILISGLDSSMQNGGRVVSPMPTEITAIVTWLTGSVSAGSVGWTAQQYDHKNNQLHLPAFWSVNPVLGNKKKRSPIL